MPDHDSFDDLLRGLDRPVAPRPEFANELRVRLLTELEPTVVSSEHSPSLRAFPAAREEQLRSPSKAPRLTMGFEIAATLLLLIGVWQLSARMIGSPEVGPGDRVPTGPAAMFGGDPGRGNQQPGPAPTGQLALTTIKSPSISFSFQPVVVGHMLYRSVKLDFGLTPATGEHGGEDALQAVDLSTGQTIWSVPASVVGTPAATTELLIARAVNWATKVPSGELIGFDAKTGAVRWTIPAGKTPAGTGGSPILVNDIVYTADSDGTAYAVDARTGDMRWTSTEARMGTPVADAAAAALPGAGASQFDPAEGWFAIGDGHFYLANDNGVLVALDLKTGARLWSFNIGKRFNLQPQGVRPVAFSGGVAVMVIGKVNGTSVQRQDALTVLSSDTGAERWSLLDPTAFINDMTVANDKLLVSRGSVDRVALRAFDISTGRVLWSYRQAHPGTAMMGVSVVGDIAYAAGSYGQLLAFDLATGAASQVFSIDDGMLPWPPVIVDGRIIMGQLPGTIDVLSATGSGATPSPATTAIATQ